MSTLFISDLHLDESRPDTIELALALIRDFAPRFDALYILGDFVEYWIGDDYCHPTIRAVFDALSELRAGNIPVRLMHGNRDFLISAEFSSQYGVELINADEIAIDIYGTQALLMHGDTLCTDDVDYQSFRSQVRSPEWQSVFLAKSVEERLAVVSGLRETSREAVKEKSTVIMDVNQQAVEAHMQRHNVSVLIHGHTHRPAKHTFQLNGSSAKRYVLGEWTSRATVLACTRDRWELVNWPDISNY